MIFKKVKRWIRLKEIVEPERLAFIKVTDLKLENRQKFAPMIIKM